MIRISHIVLLFLTFSLLCDQAFGNDRKEPALIGLRGGKTEGYPHAIYEIQIYADGRVTFWGERFAKTKGFHELRIGESSLTKILNGFDRAPFPPDASTGVQASDESQFKLILYSKNQRWSYNAKSEVQVLVDLIEQEVGIKNLVCPLDPPYNGTLNCLNNDY